MEKVLFQDSLLGIIVTFVVGVFGIQSVRSRRKSSGGKVRGKRKREREGLQQCVVSEIAPGDLVDECCWGGGYDEVDGEQSPTDKSASDAGFHERRRGQSVGGI